MTEEREVFLGVVQDREDLDVMLEVFTEGGEVLERRVSVRPVGSTAGWSAPAVLETATEPPC